MFTFKKFAIVGIAALTTLFISCSDDNKDDEDAPPSWTPGTGEAILGGVSNSAYGSSLDIDADRVYMVSELSGTVPNLIDIIFDGTNIWTPNSIKSSTETTLKNKYTASTSTAQIFNVGASVTTAEQLVDAFLESSDEDIIISSVSVGKKFGVLTSEGDVLALVTVKEKNDAAGVSIRISLVKAIAD